MKFSLRNVKADVFGRMATVVLQEEVTFTSGAMDAKPGSHGDKHF